MQPSYLIRHYYNMINRHTDHAVRVIYEKDESNGFFCVNLDGKYVASAYYLAGYNQHEAFKRLQLILDVIFMTISTIKHGNVAHSKTLKKRLEKVTLKP